MLTETFGIITPDKILGNKENRPKIIGHDKSEHIISENSMVFRKKLKSLERRWKKVSKFLGNLPSEQILYRNIPLGAPVTSHKLHLKCSVVVFVAESHL